MEGTGSSHFEFHSFNGGWEIGVDLECHSPREEWEPMDQPLWCHSLTGEWD